MRKKIMKIINPSDEYTSSGKPSRYPGYLGNKDDYSRLFSAVFSAKAIAVLPDVDRTSLKKLFPRHYCDVGPEGNIIN